MSVQMVYVVDNSDLSIYLRDDIFERLARKFPHECEIVFGVEEPGSVSWDAPQAVVARASLLGAVDTLLVAFKHDPELSPRRYVFDFNIIPGVPVTGDEEVHGVRLPGKEERYELAGGIEQCILREVRSGVLGMERYTNPVDVRDKSVIETASHGAIRIRSTKKRSLLADELKRLRQFLESQSGDTVTKRLC